MAVGPSEQRQLLSLMNMNNLRTFTGMSDHDFCRMITLRDASRLIFKVNFFSRAEQNLPSVSNGHILLLQNIVVSITSGRV
jgi:hypothetical protein